MAKTTIGTIAIGLKADASGLRKDLATAGNELKAGTDGIAGKAMGRATRLGPTAGFGGRVTQLARESMMPMPKVEKTPTPKVPPNKLGGKLRQIGFGAAGLGPLGELAGIGGMAAGGAALGIAGIMSAMKADPKRGKDFSKAFEDVQKAFGEVFLPVLVVVTEAFKVLATVIGPVGKAFRKLADVMGGKEETDIEKEIDRRFKNFSHVIDTFDTNERRELIRKDILAERQGPLKAETRGIEDIGKSAVVAALESGQLKDDISKQQLEVQQGIFRNTSPDRADRARRQPGSL